MTAVARLLTLVDLRTGTTRPDAEESRATRGRLADGRRIVLRTTRLEELRVLGPRPRTARSLRR